MVKPKIPSFDAAAINWTKNGHELIPAIAQDARSLRVLMLGYMNRESLEATLSSGFVTFYSRSKQRLWQKGETSGNVLHLIDIRQDCDNDTLLLTVNPDGPTCHLGTKSCFGDETVPSLTTLADLATTIHLRHAQPQPASYTAKLFESGIARIAQKVGEEAVETALAAATKSPALADEAADLLYHLLVLLEASGVDWMESVKILHDRSKKPQ